MTGGRTPKLPEERRNTSAPRRGEWRTAPGVGWQHGPVPRPPARLHRVARDAWATWFAAWFAAFWTPEDLPGLYVVVRLYDAVMAGDLTRMRELRHWQDTYGITHTGQAARRWLPPPPPPVARLPRPGRYRARLTPPR